jgi:ArsR family transcriptional regulator, arsenate/arsenite/antimonite-responsive transcriptional repressor
VNIRWTRLTAGVPKRSDQIVLISAPDDVIKLLADPLRAQIVALLAECPACTCHLVDDTGATQPNVSNHLRALRHAGIVVPEPRGRYTYYRLRPEVLEAAANHLSTLAARARATVELRREC